MADTKITGLLSPQVTTNPATDVLPIVNIADTLMASSGSTRKITVNQILGSGGTATLASATITGDLTVRTSGLSVSSSGVGIGSATPTSGTLSLVSRFLLFGDSQTKLGDNGLVNGVAADGNTQLQYFGSKSLFFNEGVATRMTLNATGLGVGGSPTAKISCAGYSSANQLADINIVRSSSGTNIQTGPNIVFTDGTSNNTVTIQNSQGRFGIWNYGAGAWNERLSVDSSGNVGIGVTPSAWASGFKVVQFGPGSAISCNTNASRCDVSANYFYDGANKFITASGYATNLTQENGNFYFYRSTATSGGAGAACTFTQAMTLTASGDLLVGTTGLNATWNTRLTLSSDSGTTRWAVGPYSTATNFVISGASGGGVYLNGTAATSWTSASDERLKDIIEPISNAVSKIGSLRSVIGKFKTDSEGTRRSFLIAQDVQSVLPEAVDASNPDRLGVAYTDVIPLLVAAIKELTARVEALEA